MKRTIFFLLCGCTIDPEKGISIGEAELGESNHYTEAEQDLMQNTINGADVSFQENIANGELIDLSWAASASIACWPTQEDTNFSGKHMFFSFTQEPATEFAAVVVPTEDIDVNLYMLQVGIDEEVQFPPNLSATVTCEAGYPAATNNNAGEPDLAKVIAIRQSYQIVVGVAGANGLEQGSFSLYVKQYY